MIQADHRRWARLLFNLYLGRLLKKTFGHFYCANPLPRLDPQAGLLVAPNHFSWWDGFFVDLVNRRCLARRLHIMMLEAQLRRYAIFRKVGAYSIRLEDPESVRESIEYTRTLVAEPHNLVVVYPQGAIQPHDKRPLVLKRGIARMVGGLDCPVTVMPLAFRIHYDNQRRPDVYCRFGDPLEAREVAQDFSTFERAFADNLDVLDQAAGSGTQVRDLFGRAP